MLNSAINSDPIPDEAVVRLSRDLAKAAATLSEDEARFLVDAYYTMQANRIRSAHQSRTLTEAEEPHEVLKWLTSNDMKLERQIARALDIYSASKPLGEWARSIRGIGPIIAAGLLAHIDIEKAQTVSQIWRFAGLDPTRKWERGEKRPHNAALKALCWKMGESFVKVKGSDDDIYGHIYDQRKTLEQEKNDRSEYAGQAAAMLKARPTHAQKAIYAQGKLPPGHLHARAKRYAVKMFLSHYWERGRTLAGLPVREPYPIAHLGHAHKI